MRNRRDRARGLVPVAALVGVASALTLASCSRTAADANDHGAPPVQAVSVADPLQATITTGAGSWAVVAMGDLEQPLNTFWQLFYRPGADRRWSLVTPPGVADNGGLVLGGATATGVSAGIEPSGLLEFSPVAQTTDRGASWSPGSLSDGLSAFPDALAGAPGGSLLALARAGGGEVLASAGDPSTWSEVLSRVGLSSSIAGRPCDVGGLTSVALAPSGRYLVGTACGRSGVVGLFSDQNGSLALIGPRLSRAHYGGATEVLRLSASTASPMISALVAVATPGGASIVAVWSTDGGATWQQSRALSLASDDVIVSTGVAAAGELVLLTKEKGGSLHLAAVSEPTRAWAALPSPPPLTAAVVVGAAGDLDALAVRSATLTVWRLSASARRWGKVQTTNVPILIGSSS